ncbi:hypothetical protein [Gelidibacter mesophilus]|uniref:hypothetical protein n=1 Tax=Gelidibacter mesophilus TaxID=169050 RepID=UPI000410B0DC|nr:hypothetical protein [Gelidibacter mesophilus]
MKDVTKITVPSRTDVNEKSQQIFDQMEFQLGMVPNLYATIGYSSNALENFLSFSGTAGKGSFTNKEIEAIKLAVSQANGVFIVNRPIRLLLNPTDFQMKKPSS